MSPPAEYSIWLVPEPATEKHLTLTVALLSAELGGEAFAPHVTVQGDLALDLKPLSVAVGALADRIPVQTWRVEQVEGSAHPFRCLYLRFGSSPGFDTLQSAAQATAGTPEGLSPYPHLSLVYGHQGAGHLGRHAGLTREFVGQQMVFDRLVISNSSKSVPVPEWRHLAEYPLRGR